MSTETLIIGLVLAPFLAVLGLVLYLWWAKRKV